MKFEIKHKLTGELKFSVKTSSWKSAIEAAITAKTDLTGADLACADLTRADLTGAKLTGADLTGANLTRANLTDADLACADLTGANLTGADLAGADLDFSAWPLHCGSLKAKLDAKQKRQLLYHLLAVAPEYRTKKLLVEANKFHRIPEVSELKIK